MKQRLPTFGGGVKVVNTAPSNATKGATVGTDLYDPSGKLVQWSDILNPAVTSTAFNGTSDDVPEGQFNLYFTNRRAQDALAAIIANGNSITWTYVPGTSLTADTVQDIRTSATPSFAQVALAADPSSALQAATKQYVDSMANGLSWKAPCLLATTADDTLSGLAARDGVTPTAGDRVLVMNQTSAAQNGIYVAAAGAWSRAADMSTWAQVPNASVFVEEGTVNADKGFTCTADPGGTLGATAITFVQFNGGGTSSPLTTKGDIYGFSTVNDRLPVGSNGQVLYADSTQALGLKWGPVASGAGTILVGTYASAPASPAAQTLYQCTDCPLSMIYDGTKWNYFHGDSPIALPTALSTWVNQGTATLTSFGPFQGITAPTDGGTVTARMRVKTLANTSNYTVTFLLDATNMATQFGLFGVCLYDSVGGRYIFAGFAGRGSTASGGTAVSQTINVSKFTSVTAFSADYIQYPYPNPGKIWIRIKDDGTNRITSISMDGYVFQQIHSVGRTDFVTPNSVGFMAMANSTVFSAICSCLSFTETTP